MNKKSHIHWQFDPFPRFQWTSVVTADRHFTHTDEYEKHIFHTTFLKLKKTIFYEKSFTFSTKMEKLQEMSSWSTNWKCFRWPNPKNLKICQRKRGIFLTIFCRVPALLLRPGYMTLLTRSTQVSETVFLILIFCLQQYSQSSHLSPYCFPILLILTMGVLPTLFRMLGMIFRGSGLVHIQKKSVYSQKGPQAGHSKATQHFWSFLSQPAFSLPFIKLVILDILV